MLSYLVDWDAKIANGKGTILVGAVGQTIETQRWLILRGIYIREQDPSARMTRFEQEHRLSQAARGGLRFCWLQVTALF